MGFTTGPWALDGARSPASLARLGIRAGVKESGIINPGDLKVLPLSTPGNGVRIVSGGAALENRYTADINETYVVEALSEDILDSSDNFTGITGQGSTLHHLICVTIGDPNYSTTGHPWLTDLNKPVTAEDKLDFQYVRPWVIKNVPAGVTRVEDLPSPPAFPCFALARIDVPASTSAITSGMIIDLRRVVNPRWTEAENSAPTSVADVLTVTTPNVYEYWPDQSNFATYIPKWATHCYADGFIEGFRQNAASNVIAAMKIWSTGADIGTGSSKYNDNTTGRKSINLGGKFSIPVAFRGTTQNFQIMATPQDVPSQGKLTTDAWTSSRIHLRFVEEAV